jgi:site-specific DNA recombinase
MGDKQGAVRCAIYTRKSTEEGLEQEFNSLHAQREAAEAYIQSQRHAGWMPLPRRYDDGGFSGASMDRPALRQLLAEVEAGKVDCVVVYKVDRLSRSLLDFSRLVELFDRHRVSFVSVTQEFNTTTSLGRLTLNILLSFAQFEREIIGERTRDKLGAARRKGKWIGGTPVLGYDVDPQGGRLMINEAEAEWVRRIFGIAAEAGSLKAALEAVKAQGLTTKEWASRAGRHHPGRPFSSMTLRLLLSNALYRGVVSYKGAFYPGAHQAIVTEQVWEKVNTQLALNGANLRGRTRRKDDSPLAKLLYCGQCGAAMAATHTTRRGGRYRYYVCRTAKQSNRKDCSQRQVAAVDLEPSLTRHLERVMGTELSGPILQQSIERVIYDESARRVSIRLKDGTRSEYTLAEPNRSGVSGRRTESTGRVPRVSRLMALAIKMEGLLRNGSVRSHRELTELAQISDSRLSQILRLADLAPAIQEEILFLPKTRVGTDPVTERAVREVSRVTDWDEQLKQFRALMDSARN